MQAPRLLWIGLLAATAIHTAAAQEPDSRIPQHAAAGLVASAEASVVLGSGPAVPEVAPAAPAGELRVGSELGLKRPDWSAARDAGRETRTSRPAPGVQRGVLSWSF